VCSLPKEAGGHLGTDFLEEAGATIDFVCCHMSLPGAGRAPLLKSETSPERAALAVFTQGKEGHSPQPDKFWRGKETESLQSAQFASQPLRQIGFG
jgi:hypothetical protein